MTRIVGSWARQFVGTAGGYGGEDWMICIESCGEGHSERFGPSRGQRLVLRREKAVRVHVSLAGAGHGWCRGIVACTT